ncbi:MAG: histidine phosphatase family protein [Bacteroidetes bacterium]|nr:histidine phosphatase family protein [Bacteroidota bacterium]MBL6963170.1 histidine phosphatase family protein [Bacteroidota bacterium]
MIQKNLYIIRHGETDFNKNGFLQGSSINSSLNDNGRKQAELFFRAYADIPFDKIYTSALKRSLQSVQAFAEKGISVEQYAEFNEINWGKMEGDKLNPLSWIKLRSLAKKWADGYTSESIAGGESPDDVAKRQKPVIELILSRKEEHTVLICMHGRALRILICQLLKLPLDQMDQFKHNNLGLYVLTNNENQNQFIITKNNSTSHL